MPAFRYNCILNTKKSFSFNGYRNKTISNLNESIIEKKLSKPINILDSVRKGIIDSLNAEGSIVESKDGMDCVLCVDDFSYMTLEFAAANNPLWLLLNGEIIEFKPDKFPVGKYGEELKPFTLQKTDLKKGDIIYTFTDGFADQFGRSKGKNSNTNNLKT